LIARGKPGTVTDPVLAHEGKRGEGPSPGHGDHGNGLQEGTGAEEVVGVAN